MSEHLTDEQLGNRHHELVTRGKLKATSSTSGLLAGFAMVNMVELQIEKDTPEGLLIAFSAVSTLLVCVHVFALLISTCLLPNLEISRWHAKNQSQENLYRRLSIFVETAWIMANGIGIALFTFCVCVQCWVKFYTFSFAASLAPSIIAIPIFVGFVVFVYFYYRDISAHKYEVAADELRKVESIADELDTYAGSDRWPSFDDGVSNQGFFSGECATAPATPVSGTPQFQRSVSYDDDAAAAWRQSSRRTARRSVDSLGSITSARGLAVRYAQDFRSRRDEQLSGPQQRRSVTTSPIVEFFEPGPEILEHGRQPLHRQMRYPASIQMLHEDED
ncbi:calcium release-activated calcium channel protein 1-like [Tubulanus polymorphus]|uniref:calcium release-activated calcium channel protein 1-like n=1 Tax=Tubulanus polymorphus TaxID=672921 RepID=UPI003DA49404